MDASAAVFVGAERVPGAARAKFCGVEMRSSDTEDPANLTELLTETRIILPGTEVFLAFLMTLPFSSRFGAMDGEQRLVYLSTFFATLLAVACFVAPAAYHRIARPIRHKARFKVFANTFIVGGLAFASIAFVLVTHLVTSVVSPSASTVATAVMAVVILTLWWVVPLVRAHDLLERSEHSPKRPQRSTGLDRGGRPA